MPKDKSPALCMFCDAFPCTCETAAKPKKTHKKKAVKIEDEQEVKQESSPGARTAEANHERPSQLETGEKPRLSRAERIKRVNSTVVRGLSEEEASTQNSAVSSRTEDERSVSTGDNGGQRRSGRKKFDSDLSMARAIQALGPILSKEDRRKYAEVLSPPVSGSLLGSADRQAE